MTENSGIHSILPEPPKREKWVAVYAKVSTNDVEQLKSLAVQVSAFTRLVATTPQWLLVDRIYAYEKYQSLWERYRGDIAGFKSVNDSRSSCNI